jgi:hypothetical protein
MLLLLRLGEKKKPFVDLPARWLAGRLAGRLT